MNLEQSLYNVLIVYSSAAKFSYVTPLNIYQHDVTHGNLELIRGCNSGFCTDLFFFLQEKCFGAVIKNSE